MQDVRKMFDKAYIYAYDLEGRDVTVEIVKVVAGTIMGEGGKTNKKPVMYFKGRPEKGLALNITNARSIAAMYGGFDAEKWLGKKITIYPTTTQFGSRTVECIRVRPTIPVGKTETLRADVPTPAEATTEPLEADGGATPLTAADIPFGGGR